MRRANKGPADVADIETPSASLTTGMSRNGRMERATSWARRRVCARQSIWTDRARRCNAGARLSVQPASLTLPRFAVMRTPLAESLCRARPGSQSANESLAARAS